MTPPSNYRAGHRRRLRDRFLAHGLEAMPDYEAVELLLTFVIPRKDTKPIAKALLSEFGSLENLLDAEPEDLMKISGIGPAAGTLLMLIKQLCTRYLEKRISRQPITLAEREDVINFLRMKIGAFSKESLFILYLDNTRCLIGYRTISGTVNHATVFVKELVEEALLRHACSVIVAHNHPSGICEPTQEDVNTIRHLKKALATVDIALLDSFVITKTSFFSFKYYNLI